MVGKEFYMDEYTALSRMISPGMKRLNKYLGGILQVHITRACDKACVSCTQGSNLTGPYHYMTLEQVEQALISLQGYWGVVGIFGGNPALHKDFIEICALVRKYIPFEQRGLWCNNPITLEKAKAMSITFNGRHSNLNVHMDEKAFNLFRQGWPESFPFGLKEDSRHSPVHLSMKDLGISEERRWELISGCDINQHWSAMIGVFRGELRAWFCEIAGAQSILHQDDPNYPDTGLDPMKLYRSKQWWQLSMNWYADQVREHCHNCGVPLRGYGELAISDPDAKEQVSEFHKDIYKPKRVGREVEVVSNLVQLGRRLHSTVDYVGNSVRPKEATSRDI